MTEGVTASASSVASCDIVVKKAAAWRGAGRALGKSDGPGTPLARKGVMKNSGADDDTS